MTRNNVPEPEPMGRLVRGIVVRIAFLFALLGVFVSARADADPCCANAEARASTTVAAIAMPSAGDAGIQQRVAESIAGKKTADRHFWPWWMGAVALGWLTLGFWGLMGLPLGVSNSWEKVSTWRAEQARQKQEAVVLDADAERIRAALLAETLAEFGQDAVDQAVNAPVAPQEKTAPRPRPPVSAHLTFLVMIGVGGFVSAFINNDIHWSVDLGDVHRSLFGDGIWMWLALFFGGMSVGFGTRLGGGCTSGHGLSGMSRLQIGSIIGTASFFGAAILVSLLLDMWLLK